MKDILVVQQDAVLTITINRPTKKNALTKDMYAAMADALESANASSDTKVVLIQGEGDDFTAGNDISMFVGVTGKESTNETVRFMKALACSPLPIVAKVHGAAVGIGTTLLLHCDFVYCADDTYFSLPFINLALVPEFGSSTILPNLAGHRKAAEWLMLGEPFGAEEALAHGIANKAAPLLQLDDICHKTVKKLVGKPREALRKTKALMKPGYDDLMVHIEEELNVFAAQLVSDSAKEAFDAFLNKRKPDFSQFD
jgi:enoyl-CoA hydratase/carnithine racemase